MPFIFDMLYREYCRARLAEMRKQLLLWPGTPKIAEASSDIGLLDSVADRGKSSGPSDEETITKVVFEP
jgi:hypothetical protein